MTWVRKSDDWPDQPRWAFAETEPQDESLYDRLLAWCNRYSTDGLVPLHRVAAIAHPRQTDVADSLARLMQTNPVTGEALVERAGVPGSVALAGYHVEQPSRQQVIDDREHIHKVRSEAGRMGGQRSAEARALKQAKQPNASKSPSKLLEAKPSKSPKQMLEQNPSPVPGPVPRTQVAYATRTPGARRARRSEDVVTGLAERMAPNQEALPLDVHGIVKSLPPAVAEGLSARLTEPREASQ